MKSAIRDTSAQDVSIELPSGKRRKLIISGIAAATAFVIVLSVAPAWQRWLSAEVSVPLARVRTAVVTRGLFLRDFSVQGRVVAAVSPTLYSSATGSISLNVIAGDSVELGEVLAVIDSPEIINELEREKSNLESIDIEFERQKIESRTQQLRNQQAIDLTRVTMVAAQRELERAKTSFDHGVLSQQDLEKKEDELATARVQHDHANQDAALQKESLAFELKTKKLDITRQQLLVDNLQRRAKELTVRSPVTGIVGNLAVSEKEAVQPNQPLLTVVDLGAFEIELQVPESYADALGIGTAAQIRFGQSEYLGQVSAISPEVINNQVMTRIRFAGDAPSDLRQNQRTSVRVLLEERDNVLMVQRGPFLESGSGRLAYRVSDSIAMRVPINIGSTSVSAVEIIEGLAEGDEIVISSTEMFKGAEKVYLQD